MASLTRSRRSVQKIKHYVERGLPLEPIAEAFGYTVKDLLEAMGTELLQIRLQKMAEISTALQDMALSQKSVTLTLAWYRLQAQSLNDWVGQGGTSASTRDATIPPKSSQELSQMSAEALQDEINRLIHCDVMV